MRTVYKLVVTPPDAFGERQTLDVVDDGDGDGLVVRASPECRFLEDVIGTYTLSSAEVAKLAYALVQWLADNGHDLPSSPAWEDAASLLYARASECRSDST